jgi:hypothetical protein
LIRPDKEVALGDKLGWFFTCLASSMMIVQQ